MLVTLSAVLLANPTASRGDTLYVSYQGTDTIMKYGPNGVVTFPGLGQAGS